MACWTGQCDAHLLGNNICPWTVILVQVPATPIDSHILSIQLSQPTDCLLMQPYTCQLLITCGDSKHQISKTYYNQHSIKSRYISPTIVPLYTYIPPNFLFYHHPFFSVFFLAISASAMSTARRMASSRANSFFSAATMCRCWGRS